MRDEAILVVTVISDEDDNSSDGNPADWVANLAAAKNNDQSGIVTLGLIGDLGNGINGAAPVCTAGSSDGGADDATRLRQFVTSMDNHVLGSVCENSYDAFFQQAVDLITYTCENYPVPQ